MFRNIKITHVNTVLCPKDWQWDSKPLAWSGYHIWYVMGGGATVRVDRNTYNITTGDCFLFDLNKNHFCTHNPDNPLRVSTVTVHLDDMKTSEIRRLVIRGDMILGEMLCRCVQLIGKSEENEPLAEMYLLPILNEFLTDNNEETEISSAVTQICDNLEKNTQAFYSLEDMCHMTGYSKNQIIRIFRRDTGMTPIQFQLQKKMQFAAKLLLYSDKTCGEIAYEVGINDANYFSKVFKKYMKTSPRNYRAHLGM